MRSIKKKTALITGGTKGIGLGIAESMLREGMNVIITERSQDGINEALKRLQNTDSGEVVGVVADVRKYDEMEHAVQSTIDKWGRLDVLIANAGIGILLLSLI